MLFLITFSPQLNFYLASDNNSGLQTDLSERPLNRLFSSPDCFHRHRKQPVAPFLNWVVPGPRSFRCSGGICLLASDKQLLLVIASWGWLLPESRDAGGRETANKDPLISKLPINRVVEGTTSTGQLTRACCGAPRKKSV